MALSKQIGDQVRIMAGLHKGQIGILIGKESRAWQIKVDSGLIVSVAFPQVELVKAHESIEANADQSELATGTNEEQQNADEPTDDPVQESAHNESDAVENSDSDSEENQEQGNQHEISPTGEVTISFQIQGTNIVGDGEQPPAQESDNSQSRLEDDNGEGDGDSEQTDGQAKTSANKEKVKRSAKRERSIEGIDESDLNKLNVIQLQALAISKGIGIARTKTDFLKIIKEMKPNEDLDGLRGKDLFDRVGQLHISRLRNKADLITLLQA